MSKNIDGWSDTTMPMKQEVYIDKEGVVHLNGKLCVFFALYGDN
jgi:hypothetical protein